MNLISEFDHLVSHFDGNVNDLDDIVALPMVALLTSAIGKEEQSTFFYNNDLGRKSKQDKVESMRDSAQFAESLGIDTYDYQENSSQATNELVRILNSGKKVLSFEGGRMEAMSRALERVDPKNLKNITLLSHSRWNEEKAQITVEGVTRVRTWADIRKDFPDVNVIQIRDQNGGFSSSDWTWLDKTSNPIFKATREAMKNALRPNSPQSQKKINDASDAGMLFYAITGNERGTPLDAKSFLESATIKQPSSPKPNVSGGNPPKPNDAPTVEPTENAPDPVTNNTKSIVFLPKNLKAVGFRTESNGAALDGELLGFRGGAKNETGTASLKFTGKTGTYKVILGTFDESDGQASFSLSKNGSGIGQITLDQNSNGSNTATAKNRVERTIANGVKISNGDSLTLKGFENDGEHARFDSIRFEQINPVAKASTTPKPSTEVRAASAKPTVVRITESDVVASQELSENQSAVRWELESADTLIGFRKESLSSASGKQIVGLKGRESNERGSASFKFEESAGTYDITIGAYDENDGFARFALELSDFETKSKSVIGSLELNQNLGSNVANAKTSIVSTIASGIQLTLGDVITLKGFENASEHARADFLELNRVS